jgi:hypothetical protein
MLCGIFRHLCLILTTDSYNAHSYIRLPAHAKPPRILFVLPIRPLKEFDNIQPRTPFAFFHHPLGIAFRLGRTRPVTSVFMFKRIVRARGRVGRTCIVRHDREMVPPLSQAEVSAGSNRVRPLGPGLSSCLLGWPGVSLIPEDDLELIVNSRDKAYSSVMVPKNTQNAADSVRL